MSKIHQLLIDKINSNQGLIDSWFSEQFSKNKPLFYTSVDLRHSGYKIRPVDTNCFPAGWNNLSEPSKKIAKKLVDDFMGDVKKILLIPESHTRNIRYLKNVFDLFGILSGDGKRGVVIGSLIEDAEDIFEIDLENGKKLTLEKIIRKDDKITTKSGFVADLIITNNDFTNPPGEILDGISQEIVPPTSIGWYNRTKSTHFNIYNQLAKELCELIDIDPWLISTIDAKCSNIDFKTKEGIEKLAQKVDDTISKIKEKYTQYNIDSEPYIYLKADSGTYGIGIMTVKSGEEVIHINKKQRNKMNMLKGNVESHQVIIQEGVPTSDKIKGVICEPMIYLINGNVAANLFRTNDERGEENSLNSPEMGFGDLSELQDDEISLGIKKEEVVKIYSIIARLAALAASNELQNHER